MLVHLQLLVNNQWAHTVQSLARLLFQWRWARTARLVISDLLIALSRSRRLNCEGRSSTRSVRLKLNPHTTFVVEVEGVIDFQGVQHRKSIQTVTHPDINPIQQCLTSVNRREPLVLAGHGVGFGQSCSGRLITNSVYTWVSEWHICISESPQETRFHASRIHEFKKWAMLTLFSLSKVNIPEETRINRCYFSIFSLVFENLLTSMAKYKIATFATYFMKAILRWPVLCLSSPIKLKNSPWNRLFWPHFHCPKWTCQIKQGLDILSLVFENLLTSMAQFP